MPNDGRAGRLRLRVRACCVRVDEGRSFRVFPQNPPFYELSLKSAETALVFPDENQRKFPFRVREVSLHNPTVIDPTHPRNGAPLLC